MLFGNMIFIKKTGGDGSKYPVTQKNIKIGRSEDCLIRIYNPQVAPEHCQLIIDDNGQAKLRNLSYCTVLNGKLLSQGDVTLCHGDVFKLGERLARWEYLPSSKYYKQPLSPTGRLVAIVVPQQRSVEGTSGTSASQTSVSKGTPLGSKRRYSERTTSEGGSAKKLSRMSSASKSHKNMSNVTKFLAGRHSLKGAKVLLQGGKVKQRKSTSGIISVKTPKSLTVEKSRKSTLPSWKVNIVTPPSDEKFVERRSNTRTATPIVGTEKLVKSVRKSTIKTPLRTIMESPAKQGKESPKSTRSLTSTPPGRKSSVSPPSKSLFSTPKEKSSLKSTRLIHSEMKLKSTTESPGYSREMKRMSLVVKRIKTPVKTEVKKLYDSEPRKKVKTPKTGAKEVSGSNVFAQVLPAVNLVKIDSVNETHTSRKTASGSFFVDNTPGKRSSRKSVKTPKTVTPSPAKGERLSTDQEMSVSPKKRASRVKSPVKSPVVSSTPARSRPPSVKSTSVKKSASPVKSASPRGTRRRLSPSISSAERAAKKLKTSSPKKPDKNKKAALLVLGKANRKQFPSQNVKVLLKQKIVKKAIKQSIIPPIRIDENKKSTIIKKAKKGPLKAAPGRKKKSAKKSTTGKGKAETKTSRSGASPTSSKVMVKSPSTEKREVTPKNKKEESALSASQLSLQVAQRSSTGSGEKSPSKPVSRQSKKSTSSTSPSILSPKGASPEKNSTSETFEKRSDSYSYYRRSSKRLSSKNDTSRPDFMELSPTALGLIPKNVEIFKTPKEKKRRSSSLTTPMNVRTAGIIKSASTSKIGHRKSVRFSPKDVSINSTFCNSADLEKSDFLLDTFRTPNVTLDLFVSPLLDSSRNTKLNETGTIEKSKSKRTSSGRSPRGSIGGKKCVRKLLESPQPQKIEMVASALKETRSSPLKALKIESPQVPNVEIETKTSKAQRSPKNELNDLRGVRNIFKTPRTQKSPKNVLSDFKGVRNLLRTPRDLKSPKNDLTDVEGVKKLLQTPKLQKSPQNDLTDVRGVKQLFKSPRVQKSPKNDLSDLRGVRRLLRTQSDAKSPKNDLTDVRGVKNLLRTPKIEKSPKNDLSDVRGVKQLLQSPRNQKSPKNDLSDVRGVKRLLQSPRNQKSPKNDLMDVSGVGQLFESPKENSPEKNSDHSLRSPMNLGNVVGVKELLIARSPEVAAKSKKATPRKSSVSYLKAIRGRRTIYSTPKSPKNDLSDVTGVRELFARHKPPKDYDINLTGVAELFDLPSPKEEVQKSAAKSTRRRTVKAEEEEVVTRGGRLKKDAETAKRSTRRRKEEGEVVEKEKISTKRKAVAKVEKTEPETLPIKRQTRGKKSEAEPSKEDKEGGRVPRKRKATDASSEPSPPKLRRKRTDSKTVTFDIASEESSASTSVKTRRTKKQVIVQSKSSKTTARTGVKPSAKGKDSGKTAITSKVQAKTSGTTTKAGAKPKAKVQTGRSQRSTSKKVADSSGEKKISPRKTRSVKVDEKKVQTKKVGIRGKEKVSPVVKRSTRRK